MSTRQRLRVVLHRITAAVCLYSATGAVADAGTRSAESLARADARLAAVGYRLSAFNSDQCNAPEMITGLSLHDLGSYDRRDRRIMQANGMGAGFTVRTQVTDGASARSGLLVGDEIVAVNGHDVTTLGASLISSRASYRRVELFVATLDQALRAAPAALTVRRGGQMITLTLAGDRGCGGVFTLQPGRSLNAWADGRYVAVTTRVMDLAAGDDELAFVLAHEMAHNMLHHRVTGSHASLFPGVGKRAGKIKQMEIDADQLAVRLIASAGYDAGAPERFLRRAAPTRWADLAITHPTIGRRIQLVNAVKQDIDRANARVAIARFGGVPAFAWGHAAFVPRVAALANPATSTLQQAFTIRPALASSLLATPPAGFPPEQPYSMSVGRVFGSAPVSASISVGAADLLRTGRGDAFAPVVAIRRLDSFDPNRATWSALVPSISPFSIGGPDEMVASSFTASAVRVM